MDLPDVMRKAQKLAAFTNGTATQAEIENAAEKLAALLREHNLTMTDITPAQARSDILETDIETGFKRLPAWYIRLGTGIGQGLGCRFMHFLGMGYLARFIGASADVSVCVYFMGLCAEQLPKMAAASPMAIIKHPSWNRDSYLAGVSDAISLRLSRMYAPPVMESAERGLMVVKRDAIAEHLKAKHPKVQHGELEPPTHMTSFQHGFSDGQKLQLQQPLPAPMSDPALSTSRSMP